MEIPNLGLYGTANRAVFVLDDDGTIVYNWITAPTNEPDYNPVIAAAQDT